MSDSGENINSKNPVENGFTALPEEMPSFDEHMKNLAEKSPKDTLNTPENSAEALPRDFSEIMSDINQTDVELLKSLSTTNPNAKDEFLANPELRAPNDTHDKLDKAAVEGKLARIDTLTAEIASNPSLSDKERRTAMFALTGYKRKNDLVLACANYNENPTPENADQIRSTNEVLYGAPDKDTYLSLLWEKLDTIESRNLTPEEQQEYTELRDLLGPLERATKPRFRPQPETVARFSEMVNLYMEPIFEHIPKNQDEFDAEQAAAVMREALADFIPDDSEWEVTVDPNATAVSTEEKSKRLVLAGKRARGNFDQLGLKKIIAHEFGTHFLRALPFEHSNVEMLRTGLSSSLDFEEGVAKAMEHGVAGKFEDSGIDHYISVGLATFQNADFRTAFEIQKRLSHLTTGDERINIMYNSVWRAFRGTGAVPVTKDLTYYNGSEKVWKFIEKNIYDPNLFDNLFLRGKIDFEDPAQEQMSYEAKVNGL